MSVIIIHHRKKCIACHYCVDVAPDLFYMDEQDGKASLINSTEKKGIFTVKILSQFADTAQQAQAVCPMKIIDVRLLTRKFTNFSDD